MVCVKCDGMPFKTFILKEFAVVMHQNENKLSIWFSLNKHHYHAFQCLKIKNIYVSLLNNKT